MNDDLVYWSVAEVNRRRGVKYYECPVCHKKTMQKYNDVNPAYKSQYNPGECLIEHCPCGYYQEFPC